jgi:hypothetical protein
MVETDHFPGGHDQQFVDFLGSVIQPHALRVLKLVATSVEKPEEEWLIDIVFRECIGEMLAKTLLCIR